MISKSEKKELDYRQVISTTTQTHVLTVPRGESFKVVLCDGTEVWLNANSNFVYPTAFIGDERIVTLEGEAYFKVAKDPERPFIVKPKLYKPAFSVLNLIYAAVLLKILM